MPCLLSDFCLNSTLNLRDLSQLPTLKALKATGIPPILLQLIQDLHVGSASKVRMDYAALFLQYESPPSDLFHSKESRKKLG